MPLIDDIVRGRLPDERPADVIFLTVLMALELLAVEEGRADQAGEGALFETLIERAGKILCPLLDYAKPDTYRVAMQELRRQYAGIASDLELQSEYAERVTALVSEGALSSLEAAIEADAASLLEPRQLRA